MTLNIKTTINLNLSELDKEVSFPLDELFLLNVIDDLRNHVKYEFLIRFSSENQNLIVFGNDAYKPHLMKVEPPIFLRHSWEKQFQESVIYFYDPTIYNYPEYGAGWGVGNKEDWYLPNIAKIICILTRKRKISNEDILFVGFSAGGFMALILSAFFKKSAALVNNPQVNLRNHKQIIESVLDYYFSESNKEEVLNNFLYRFDAVELFKKKKYMPNITYCCNIDSHPDYNDLHYLITEITKSKDQYFNYKNVNVLLYSHKDGHKGILGYEDIGPMIKEHFQNSFKGRLVSNLYFNTGNGFNNNYKEQMFFSHGNDITLFCNLEKYNSIKNLRFDPVEGIFSKCKIKNVASDAKSISMYHNANCTENNQQLFLTDDPQYLIKGDFKNATYIMIKYSLSPINNIQLSKSKLTELEKNWKKVESIGKQNSQKNSLKADSSKENYISPSIIRKLIFKFPILYILLNMNKTGIKRSLLNMGGYEAIKKNNLLDEGYYLKNNNSVKLSGMDPILHYMYHGFKEGKKPNSSFDGNYYLKKYKDVRKSNLNPLVHYSLYGIKEGRKTKKTMSKGKRKEPEIKLTKSEIKKKYDEILYKNSIQVDLCNFDENSPLISIIMANRNGLNHLKRLFKNFKENVQYSNYEVIVVDNGSTDDSIKFLEGLSKVLPIKIIKNGENRTFSEANNQAAEIANGEYLLLLNNDVEPLYGWLNQMMQTALKYDDIGAVGAKLIYPDCSNSKHNKHNSFKIQHMGIAFKKENAFIKPYNIVKTDPFDVKSNLESEKAAVTAAALLVQRDRFWQVGGLDENYNYGYEDVDLCLKLHKNGYRNVYCAKAVLFHYEFGTQEKNENLEVRDRRKSNRKVFSRKWNQWLHEQLINDKLNNNQIFSEAPLKISIKIAAPNMKGAPNWGDYDFALALKKEFEKNNYETVIHTVSQWDENDDVDIVLVLRGLNRYKPKTGQFNIMWNISHPDLVSVEEYNEFDYVFVASDIWADELKTKVKVPVESLIQCTDSELFYPEPSEEYKHDILFVGNSRHVFRRIVKDLLPTDKDFGLYGGLWDQFIDKKYIKGRHIKNTELHKAYSSCKILLNDHWEDMAEKGFISNRLFDGFAAGAFVISDEVKGAEDIFGDALVTYSGADELHELIDYYLDNDLERVKKVEKGRKIVLANHTFEKRAERILEVINDELSKDMVRKKEIFINDMGNKRSKLKT